MSRYHSDNNDLEDFENFRVKVITQLQNYKLSKINPIFDITKNNFSNYNHRIDITYPILDIKINPTFHPSSTLNQPRYLSAPTEDKELTTWTAYLKKGNRFIVIAHLTTQSKYEIYDPETTPFYIRLLLDAAMESFKSSIVFISDRLPYELRVSIYPRREYKKSKQEDLLWLAEQLLSKINKPIEKKVKRISGYPFNKAAYEILKLSGQPIKNNISFCLACGTRLKGKEKKFCKSNEVPKIENPGNCRDKFHNWLRRRLGAKDLTEEHRLRDHYYQELQDTIRMEGAYEGVFVIFRRDHPELYEARRPGPKKKKKKT